MIYDLGFKQLLPSVDDTAKTIQGLKPLREVSKRGRQISGFSIPKFWD